LVKVNPQQFCPLPLKVYFPNSSLGRVREQISNLVAVYYFDRAVVVTVTGVRMMQMVIDEIIHVIAVRYRLMPATGAMVMTGLVTSAIMIGRATFWIF
jgi:hypothetical protein